MWSPSKKRTEFSIGDVKQADCNKPHFYLKVATKMGCSKKIGRTAHMSCTYVMHACAHGA